MDDKIISDRATKLANDHISWFLTTIQPLLFSHYVHGYGHGYEDALADSKNHKEDNG